MYNYLEAMKNDIKEYIKDNIELKDYSDKDDLHEHLNDDLWIDDSVTGNASGSYTFNSARAKEYVLANIDLVHDMAVEFCEENLIGDKFMNEEWEWFDVSIRCYLLGSAISEVLDEMEENDELNFED